MPRALRVRRRLPAIAVAAAAAAATLVIAPGLSPVGATARAAVPACPWLNPEVGDIAQRAAQLVAHMTTAEKAAYVAIPLHSRNAYENYLPGVPRLCLPSLRLQDGPAGVAFGASRVTALPAPLALAATWDPHLASAYGDVIGEESKAKGINVAQTPMLNLARTPQGGRDYEGFGEDPALVTAMGDSEITAIQHQGVIAQAKHLVANDQEVHRSNMNEVIDLRTLREVYLPPFGSAVRRAHVGSVMCAMNQVDSVYACQSPPLLAGVLRHQWGFPGFVRSDFDAVHDPTAALPAGDDLVKPLAADKVESEVNSGGLSEATLDAAVEHIVETMFRFGLITSHPEPETPGAPATSAAHRAVAARVAAAGTVLLRNQSVRGHVVLPLRGRERRSIAVIGTDAWSSPDLSGGGSSYVAPNRVVTPLEALRDAAPRGARIRYAAGTPYQYTPQPVPPQVLTVNGRTRGLTKTVIVPGRPAQATRVSQVSADFGTAAQPTAPPGAAPGDFSMRWVGTLVPARSGHYRLRLDSDDGGVVSVGGRVIGSAQRGDVNARPVWLTAGQPVSLQVEYTDRTPGGKVRLVWGPARDPGSSIESAGAAAAKSQVAVVFVSVPSHEGIDHKTLALPAIDNTLIERVARRNPRTVVVLNTGGPVLMPWLRRVAAVVQAWYPGELDGTAITRVLTGEVDPSGRLPMTFPTSATRDPTASALQWPGVDDTIDYSEGLDIGYRWYAAHHVRPLFPFGFGLSYTSFRLSRLRVTRSAVGGAHIGVAVTNRGHRTGSTVVQAYLHFPGAAHEPPIVLKGFRKVRVRPGHTTRARIRLPSGAFDYWNKQSQKFQPASGRYQVRVGQNADDLPLRVSVPSSWSRG